MSNILVNGAYKSGRFNRILDLISKHENVSPNSLLNCPDVKTIDYIDSIENIEEYLYYLIESSPIILQYNYCIVKNIDFCSLDKQEMYLKYSEDSNIKFYFTSYNLNKIESKALLSRLKIVNHSFNLFQSLSEDNKKLYSSYLNLYYAKSIVDLEFAAMFSKDLKKLLNFDFNFFQYLEEFKSKIEKYNNYPEWFLIETLYNSFHHIFLDMYKNQNKILEVYKKMINVYNEFNIDNITALCSFILLCNVQVSILNQRTIQFNTITNV